MNPFLKISAFFLLCIAVLVAAAITLTVGWLPVIGPRARPLTSVRFERTPERLARGKYLVEAVTACLDCHSPHDWTTHDAAIPPGMEGAGGDLTGMKGLPGRIVAQNLTPDAATGAGTWSDDAMARAIREGVGHDGRALFPLMPYNSYRILSDEDVASIVVYLRSLPPVRNPLPPTKVKTFVKYMNRTLPQPITDPVPDFRASDPVRRGSILIIMAACADCHTPLDRGRSMTDMEFGGGQIFEGPWGRVASANLTPDPSGIPYYDQALFLQVMRTGYTRARLLNQIMPWYVYRNMTDDDLKAIFAYLKTIKPVKHFVDNSQPATLCPVCSALHGGGDKNKK